MTLVAVGLIAFVAGAVIGIVVTINWVNHRITSHERAMRASREHRDSQNKGRPT
jgi:hypothetical protein